MKFKDYIVDSFNKGNSFLCAQDVENLKNWFDERKVFDSVQSLTEEGYQEIFGIGKRLRATFKELLRDLGNSSYRVRSAYGPWVENGAEAFVKGFSDIPINIEPANPNDNIIAVSNKMRVYNIFLYIITIRNC